MTGDMEKNRRLKSSGTDESSSAVGGGRQMSESNNSSPGTTPNARLSARNGEEQPLFKKPRLDVSFAMLPEFQYDDGSIILRNCDSVRTDDGNGQECSTEHSGECSTCGDTGSQSELFRCTKCSVRLQHTYCSNSYNPKKRWFIGLCNWCEMDVARTPGGGKQQLQGAVAASSKRDGNSSWVERRNAVDCLLGAALRLPSAGLSNMEELLPQASRAAKGRRSPSFDTVEKAKRSGPSCDSAVKTNKRSSPGSLSGSTTTAGAGDGKAQTSSSSGGAGDGSDPKDDKSKISSHQPQAKASSSSPGAGNGKENVGETISNNSSGEKRLAAKSGGGGESEKLSSAATAARRSPSGSNIVAKSSRKSPLGDYDDKSETTVDNTVRSSLRRSPSRCTAAAAAGGGGGPVKSEGGGAGDEERKGKDGSCSSRRIAGEKLKAANQNSPSGEVVRRWQDRSSSRENGAAAVATVDRKSPVLSDSSSVGGSDCSNLTEVRRNGLGIISRDNPLRKSQSFKQQQTQARLVRPNLVIGKTKSHTMETSRTPRKLVDLKDPKLRRSSSSPRVTGAHFKCLSDILC